MIIDYKVRVKDPELIIIDLFCGAGGTSTGFEMAEDEIAMVVAAINHDPKAIKSHWINHPHVEHFEEDITVLYGFQWHGILFKSPQFVRLVRLVNMYRAFYPNTKIILWASLECTNFSKAKGGQPRDADSRTLADHLHPYIIAIDPDYIQIENVVEFMSWGPLDEKGKPVSRKNGQDYLRWCYEVKRHGYFDDWKELNSADFGAYTSRNRLFGILPNQAFQ
jgi:DNA (cytosine-5)-methyltransferase 1